MLRGILCSNRPCEGANSKIEPLVGNASDVFDFVLPWCFNNHSLFGSPLTRWARPFSGEYLHLGPVVTCLPRLEPHPPQMVMGHGCLADLRNINLFRGVE